MSTATTESNKVVYSMTGVTKAHDKKVARKPGAARVASATLKPRRSRGR